MPTKKIVRHSLLLIFSLTLFCFEMEVSRLDQLFGGPSDPGTSVLSERLQTWTMALAYHQGNGSHFSKTYLNSLGLYLRDSKNQWHRIHMNQPQSSMETLKALQPHLSESKYLITMALLQYFNEDPVTSLKSLDKVEMSIQNTPLVLQLRSLNHLKLGKTDLAFVFAESSLKSSTRNEVFEPRWIWGELYGHIFENRNPDIAAMFSCNLAMEGHDISYRVYETGTSLIQNGDTLRGHQIRGCYLAAKGYHDLAFSEYLTASQLHPKEVGLYHSLADLAGKLHYYRNERDYITYALKLKPEDVNLRMAHYEKVVSKYGAYKEAIESWLELKNRFPKDNGVIYNLGYIYYLQGQSKQAEALFREFLATDSTNATVFLDLVKVLPREKKLEKVTLLKEAIRLAPYWFKPHEVLATLASDLGKSDYELALKHFQLALELGGSWDTNWTGACVSLFRLSKIDEARGCFATYKKNAGRYFTASRMEQEVEAVYSQNNNRGIASE